MLSPLIKREIFKEAKRCHYQVPSDYEKILEKAQKVNTISDDKIVFSWLYNSDSVVLWFLILFYVIKDGQ